MKTGRNEPLISYDQTKQLKSAFSRLIQIVETYLGHQRAIDLVEKAPAKMSINGLVMSQSEP